MNITYASASIIPETNPLAKIELCGRVCYKSESRITPTSAYKFVEKLRQNGHTSVLEHARVNVTLPARLEQLAADLAASDDLDEGIRFAGIMSRFQEIEEGFTMNVRDYLALFPDATLEEVAKMEPADDYMTVRFVCDRGIANELVRHRVFSFSQESTRYVNYESGVTFVVPEPFIHKEAFRTNYYIWKNAVTSAECAYRALLEAGVAPQEARNVLPLSTKTELIMTGTLPQWAKMLELRTAAGAHPQMRLLMVRLLADKNLPAELGERRGAFRGDFTI